MSAPEPQQPAATAAAPADAGDVSKGELAASTVYPGTWREYWVYVPKALDRTKPAPVMVFQDGLQYNAPAVFDDLIRQKAIPPMVGVFVMHGRVKALSPDALDRMNRSLEYAGYDVRHVWGDGAHNSRHATEIFPEVLRWLWRDWPAPIVANPAGASRQDVFQVLVPGEGWQVVSDGHRNTDGPAVNGRGEMFFTDPANNRIHKVGLDGKVSVFAESTSGANGMMFGPDGRLYAGATRTRQIVAHTESGGAQVLAEDVSTNDLAVSVKGDLYFTDSPGKRVWLLPKGGKPRVVDEGIESPNGVLFSPDQSLLYVSDHAGQLSWVFQVQPDGSLAHKQRYFYVHLPDAAPRSGADGMAVDADGRVYIATALGVQVFDQIGKCHAIIPAPQRGSFSNVEFGGANFDELFVTNGDKVFKRKTKVKGVLSWRAPVKPAAPRL